MTGFNSQILKFLTMTKQELRHAYFAAKDELRQIMLDEYIRHGEETRVPEMWTALSSLWGKMNDFCKKL